MSGMKHIKEVIADSMDRYGITVFQVGNEVITKEDLLDEDQQIAEAFNRQPMSGSAAPKPTHRCARCTKTIRPEGRKASRNYCACSDPLREPAEPGAWAAHHKAAGTRFKRPNGHTIYTITDWKEPQNSTSFWLFVVKTNKGTTTTLGWRAILEMERATDG